MNLYYYDFPRLPDDMIEEVYKSLKGVDIYPYPLDEYQSFAATQPLQEYTKNLFDFSHNTLVQIIKDNLGLHKDLGRKRAYNYIIEPGGDNVLTCWHDEEKNLIESHCINVHRWHKLNVDVFHSVENVTRPRISITINDKAEMPPELQW